MSTFPQWIWIALVAVAVLVAVVAIMAGVRRSRAVHLHEHFGREYDRTVDETWKWSRGEDELVSRAEDVQKLDIRPLTAAEHERYMREWNVTEQRFVERPKSAVAQADELVTDLMRTRGYPMEGFEQHSAHLSVKHPRIVEHYRAGHAIVTGAATASTADLRHAMLHYRTLFEDLASEGIDTAREVWTDREAVQRSPGTTTLVLR